MVAELHTEAQGGYQVDDKYCVHFSREATQDDIKHPHDSHQLEEYEENTKCHYKGKRQAGHDLHSTNYYAKRDKDILEQNSADVCVLIVVDVVKTVCEYNRSFFFMFFSFKIEWV